ncbi:nucleolar protein 56, partial [Nematocida minor]|uniref:nucleolar protein 56 n=1 Tax=Nematocida minor TaxID=1912983 RepID=UPI002220FF25
ADKAYALEMKEIGIKMVDEESSLELLRAVRGNADFLFSVDFPRVQKSQVSLSHAISRKNIKYDNAREDHAVMQCISMLDDMTVDINDYFMRIKEMYSWHFPELIDLCKTQIDYLGAIGTVGNRETADKEAVLQLENGDAIVDAMNNTIGGDLTEEDLTMIMELSGVVMEKIELYTHAVEHLEKRLSTVAPNLTALVGKMVAARLILKAGGLSKLAMCPSSTIQVLGAEKALFRAMKSKAKTPKYGLIFHSSFINSTAPRMRGRVSRYLSSKCALASRIDCYSERVTDAYGVAMKGMVEERAKGKSMHHMPTDTVLQKVSEDLEKQNVENH